MKLKIISFSLLLVGVFLSCKKQDEASIAVNTKTQMLSQVKIDNQPSIAYSYNTSSLISEEKGRYDFSSYHYNANNQLVTTDYYTNNNILSSDQQVYTTAINQQGWFTPDITNKGGTISYEYNDKAQLIKSTYTPVTGSSQYSEFSYGTNDKISRQLLYWDNKETGYIDYSYDAGGNLTQEDLYYLSSTGVAELSTTMQYAFDTQQNPYKSVSRLMTPGINTNPNNIIKETYTIHLKADQGGDKVEITETTYKYNGTGFPISKNGNTEYIYG